MAAQKGLDMLLKVYVTSAFVTLGGMKTKSITINTESVDITNDDSSGRFRELLSGAGVISASISGSGVFVDNSADEEIRSRVFSGTIGDFQLVIPDFGTIEGAFLVASVEFGTNHNGEVTFNITLESADAFTWTAA